MVIEFILSNLPAILGIISVVGGSGLGMWKFHKNQVEKAFKTGKQEETCLNRIEQKADSALEGLKKVEETLSKEVEQARDQHQRIYDKIDKQGESISRISTDISYIRGKLEPKET